MADSSFLPSPFPFGKLVAILVVVAAVALAFAWTAGWLSPHRLTPVDLVTAVQPPTGPALGHRRNHAKGICFTGTFTANGAGTELSTAQIFERGEYPVVGRFNIAGGDPKTPDPMAQLHGMGLRLLTPKAQEWRMAMIDAPFFAAPTPQDFYTFLKAAGSKDPNDFKHYVQGHPEILTFIGWVKTHPRTEGWAEDRFNSLNSFVFTDASGKKQVVRWSFIPAAPVVALTQEQLAQAGPNYLEADITKRIAAGPQRWEMMVTIANPGDPTADPTKAWPADRRTVDVGTLTAQHLEQEADGPCRDINYDPTVLPPGISTSDDPFPAARSAAYRVSYDGRMAESSHYPHQPEGATK